jgi:prepilin signal peptidase PulO-like enzyme (type II secretory pathway)
VQLREILATPAVAVVLGFLIGIGLIGATAWSRKLPKSKDAMDSIAVMMAFMTGGMLLASAVLVAYVFAAPSGFLYFGLALSAGFVIGLGVFSVVLWRQ